MKSILTTALIAGLFSGCTTPPSKSVYPIKASLQVGFDIDDHGFPQNVTIVSWTGPESEKAKIQESAIRAVRSWLLNPNLRGRHLIQPMEFNLENDAPTPETKQSTEPARGK